MSNRRNKADTGISAHPGLFDTGMSEGALDVLLGLKQLMSREMSACNKDRYQIAAEISRLTQRDVSKDMLDKYVSSDPAYRPPADMMVAFCYVVGSRQTFRYLLEPLNAEVVDPTEMKYLKLARLEEQRRQLEAEIQQVRSQCGIK